MRVPKSVLLGSAALAVLLVGAGMPETAIATQDKFKITCMEDGDAQAGAQPKYICTIKQNEGPGKPKHENEGFPKNQEFLVDMDKLMLFPPREGTGPARACPGWFFINGTWRYFAAPPCPWRDVNDVAGSPPPKK